MEVVHRFEKQMPVGRRRDVHRAASFASYPRWEDKIEYTLAEIKNGPRSAVPGRRRNPEGDTAGPKANMVSLQGIFVDGNDRLWALDTGTVNMKPVDRSCPRVLCIDTKSNNRIERTYSQPPRRHPRGS
jgi:hypothetical protein